MGSSVSLIGLNCGMGIPIQKADTMKHPSAPRPNERLKQERVLHGWTQADVAGFLGTDGYTVNRWERGRAQPSLYFRRKLCELFGKSAVDLCLVSAEQESSGSVSSPPSGLLPAFWSLPHPRNPFFTGREETLATLHAQLGPDQQIALTQSYALHGLGGIGKTQLALEYAYRYASEYSAVFWIGAETVEQVHASLLRIAERLDLPERVEIDQQRIVAAVQRWLETHGEWLLIWDNLEDLDLLQRYLPASRQGAFLLTTRRQTLGTVATLLELPPLSNEEGVTLLLRRARKLSSFFPEAALSQQTPLDDPAFAEAVELVQLLEGLPLALDQAGAYIEETGCSLADYLRRYHEQRQHVLARRGAHAGAHPASVATTLQLAAEQVERQHPAAADLLRASAFLHPEVIPEELFVAGAAHLGPVLGPTVVDPYQFDLALAALRSASLLARHGETRTLSVHRLVQAVLQDQMEPGETRLWSERVVRMVNAAFPEPTFETRAQCERCLAQALACVPLLKVVGTNLPEVGELLYKTGSYLLMHGRYREAASLLEQALVLGEQQYGLDHPLLIPRLKRRAELFWKQGQYERAEPLLQRILAIGGQHLEPEHPEIAETLNNLAALYHSQGKYAEAEPLYQQALHLEERQLGFEHLEIADTLSNLALLYGKQGKYEQAEPLYQRALRIQEQQLGPSHAKISYTLANLALLYWQQGKYEQAESLYQRALHIREQQLGPEHPDMSVSQSNLASLYQDQGKYEQAESLYQRALHIQEQQLHNEHPELARTCFGLASLYQDQGKYEQAEPLYQRALHIQQRQLNDEHPELARICFGLASLYQDQGKYEQAEPLYQRALHIQQRQLGPEHPDTANTLHGLAVFRHKQGELNEAIALAQRALTIRSQSLGDAHPKTVISQAHYTQLLQALDALS